MLKILIIIFICGICNFIFMSCSENSISLYIALPESLKKVRIASFYGSYARKNCEAYRRFYTGFCDTTSQPFVTCYDLDDKKYKATSCE